MKFKLLGNAGGIFTGSEGTKILCDPWIVDGAFDSWFHYPPLSTKIDDLQDVDAIYISHIHQDHYDEDNFDFPKDTPLLVLDEGPNFLIKNLFKNGFTNIIKIKDKETIKFKEFDLTIYKPFSAHIYEESLLGNLIDSALALQNNGITALNFNDNTPDEKSCRELINQYGTIDLAMLNYNAAGPYPSCFDNLSETEKKEEHNFIMKRNFDHLCNIIPILKPKSVLPFAGSYIIAGKNYFKNEYLGTTTWDVCADYLNKNLKFETNVTCLRENQTFDIALQKNLQPYERINLDEMKKYINTIKNHKYSYEKDLTPNLEKLKEDIFIAKDLFDERIKKFNVDIQSNVFLTLEGSNVQIIKGRDQTRSLVCEMDIRLLRRILDRKFHWNNAESGTHINFIRTPNKMDRDLHTSLAFFHL